MTFSEKFGGEIGPLLGSFLAKASMHLKDKYSDNTFEDWLRAYKEGIQAITAINEASKGDRTVLDALIPGLDYLEKLNKKEPNFSFKDMTEAIK